MRVFLNLLLALGPLLLLLPGARAGAYAGPASLVSFVASFPVVATAIEDHKACTLMVATSPQNYAFFTDPATNPYNWSSVSVNFNGEVYVSASHQPDLAAYQLTSMNESQVEFIKHTFQHFAQDLVFPAVSPHIQLVPAQTQALDNRRRHYLPATARGRPGYGASLYPSAKPQPVPTNYFNLDQMPHNLSLLGDVYNFDLTGRVLDIYSNSVSLHQGERSIIYREASYFSYSRPGMPVNINRFFLDGDFLLFVYQDGSVLAKPADQLEEVEAALVLEARKEVEELLKLRPCREARPALHKVGGEEEQEVEQEEAD